MKFYYSHGRTAFKYGLKYLNLKKNDNILVPEYICDVVLEPLVSLKIKPIFYEVDKNFKCNLENIKKKFNTSVKAFLLVNYFGFEEDKKKYLNFCKSKNIYMIEDSCHSLSLKPKNTKKLSDFIFYSPKKIIPTMHSGGLLTINRNSNTNVIIKANKKLYHYKVNFFEIINSFLEKNLFLLKRYLKFLFLKKPTYDKFNSIKNKRLSKDFLIDRNSLNILNKTDLKKIYKLRMKNYNLWKKFCLKNDRVFLINRTIKKGTIPWLLPAYIENFKLKKKLFNFGWSNGYVITSWPTLPKNVINKKIKKKWNNLICFNTDRAPKDNVDF